MLYRQPEIKAIFARLKISCDKITLRHCKYVRSWLTSLKAINVDVRLFGSEKLMRSLMRKKDVQYNAKEGSETDRNVAG